MSYDVEISVLDERSQGGFAYVRLKGNILGNTAFKKMLTAQIGRWEDSQFIGETNSGNGEYTICTHNPDDVVSALQRVIKQHNQNAAAQEMQARQLGGLSGEADSSQRVSQVMNARW